MSNKTTETKTIPNNANLVLLGGGIYSTTARPMLELGVNIAKKEQPNVLLVPTPKVTSEVFDETVDTATKLFQAVGATVSLLHRYNDVPDQSELQEKVDGSDIIYVPGGSTKHALEQWKAHGIDHMLSDAMQKGKVITGMSAGALAWFKEGLTDSDHYTTQEGDVWEFDSLEGMGHIDAFMTPHFNSSRTPDGRKRSEHFIAALAKKSEQSGRPEFGLGIDNNAGLLAVDGLIRIVATKPTSSIHVVRVEPNGDSIITDLVAPRVDVREENTSIDQLDVNGITWEDFYLQLAEPVKSPQATASASSKVL